MAGSSLEEALSSADNPVEFLRQNTGRHPYPIQEEFTNWIEEERSWQETCSLSDLSHHQRDLYVSGQDALSVFRDLGINDFSDFRPGDAKQFVACNPDGYVIGDGILFNLEEDRIMLTGTPIAPNWVEYNLEIGDYAATFEADERYHDKDEPHRTFRYQLQGPNALAVMEESVDDGLPDIPFFTFTELAINGRECRVLRHSMSSDPGFEIWGPWGFREEVREELIQTGQSYGLRRLGEKSYKAQGPEKGWIARPVPAIYGEDFTDYREWLSADSYEGISSIGGSFASDDISDYYLTPVELGYASFIDFDHDFVGKDAVRDQVANPRREKVTLVWDDDDVLDIFASLLTDGETYKFFDLSMPYWSVFHYDTVVKDGANVGLSKYFGYTYNERVVLSLAVIDRAYSDPGTEVSLVWGEPGGTSPNPKVEPHEQMSIQATVAPNPYVEQ